MSFPCLSFFCPICTVFAHSLALDVAGDLLLYRSSCWFQTRLKGHATKSPAASMAASAVSEPWEIYIIHAEYEVSVP